jgi:ADP-ribosyl-[dinitrogen reductase] hydrolase
LRGKKKVSLSIPIPHYFHFPLALAFHFPLDITFHLSLSTFHSYNCIMSDLPSSNDLLRSRFNGLLLGQAVGDALGLPWEGLSRSRAAKMYGTPDSYRFLFGRGMISDDTEHACMTAQALLAYPEDPELFARSLGWKLRWWLAALPAGAGFATLRAIMKLWAGVLPSASGVFSAGNGPAMRAPVIGAFFEDDLSSLRSFVRVSTRLTHIDPKAEEGALVIALSARWAVMTGTERDSSQYLLDQLSGEVTDPELVGLLECVAEGLSQNLSVDEFADSMGFAEGVSGYIYHTVPVVLFAFLRHLGDFDRTVKSVIALGGDADSTGAVVGALAGAATGYEGIPSGLVRDIMEWPRSVSWMKRLSGQLSLSRLAVQSSGQIGLFWPGIIPRNLLFLITVLFHGFRRLLPPY